MPRTPPVTIIPLLLTELEAVDLLHGLNYLVLECKWPPERLARMREFLQNNVSVRAFQDRVAGPMQPPGPWERLDAYVREHGPSCIYLHCDHEHCHKIRELRKEAEAHGC